MDLVGSTVHIVDPDSCVLDRRNVWELCGKRCFPRNGKAIV